MHPCFGCVNYVSISWLCTFTAFENVVLAKRTGRMHAKPFGNTHPVEMMVAR
jgi:hypothetical protein